MHRITEFSDTSAGSGVGLHCQHWGGRRRRGGTGLGRVGGGREFPVGQGGRAVDGGGERVHQAGDDVLLDYWKVCSLFSALCPLLSDLCSLPSSLCSMPSALRDAPKQKKSFNLGLFQTRSDQRQFPT